jgi:hypothetical protein
MKIKLLAFLIVSGGAENYNYDECWEDTNYTGTVSKTMRSRFRSIYFCINRMFWPCSSKFRRFFCFNRDI